MAGVCTDISVLHSESQPGLNPEVRERDRGFGSGMRAEFQKPSSSRPAFGGGHGNLPISAREARIGEMTKTVRPAIHGGRLGPIGGDFKSAVQSREKSHTQISISWPTRP